MKIIKTPTVKYICSTPNPRRVAAIAARMTYSPRSVETLTENITNEEISASVKAILEKRHFSCLRHVTYTFSVSGVSRALSHQLVRHTVGHSFEQRSQHYRVEEDPSYIEPPTIEHNASASVEYQMGLMDAETTYRRLRQRGVPKEDARMILPNGIETQLLWSCNLEAIYNFIKTRACRVNCSEIISVATQVRKLVLIDFPEIGPYLGPTCFSQGLCFEGQKYYKVCNLPWKTPSILWTPKFPEEIEWIGVEDKHVQK